MLVSINSRSRHEEPPIFGNPVGGGGIWANRWLDSEPTSRTKTLQGRCCLLAAAWGVPVEEESVGELLWLVMFMMRVLGPLPDDLPGD